MKTLLLFSPFGLTIIVYNCLPEEKNILTSDEEMRLQQEITLRYNAWMRAEEAMNIDSVVEFMAEDILFASDGALLHGRESVVAIWRPRFAALDQMVVMTDTSAVQLLPPTVAVQAMEVTASATDTSGVTSGPYGLIITFV
ncbi:MAG: hypothetical protein GF372_11935 [Candidatus Marinimicrobia bacterium]|nr:hypothetical protein [Candidatus Neomarinimicrobiota bacterium]